MTTIFLCRHGETEFSRDDRYYFKQNSPLTDVGWRQTESLATTLCSEPLRAVFSSPLERAICTAEQIARRHNLPLDILPTLVEWNPGDWSGLTRREVRSLFPEEYELWAADPAVNRPLRGESFHEVAQRALPAFLALTKAHPSEVIAVVGHNTLNRIILAHLLGISLSNCRARIVQEAGALNQIRYDSNQGWQINILNSRTPVS